MSSPLLQVHENAHKGPWLAPVFNPFSGLPNTSQAYSGTLLGVQVCDRSLPDEGRGEGCRNSVFDYAVGINEIGDPFGKKAEEGAAL